MPETSVPASSKTPRLAKRCEIWGTLFQTPESGLKASQLQMGFCHRKSTEEEVYMAKNRLPILLALTVIASCLYAADKSEKQISFEGTLVSSACYLPNDSHQTGNDMGGEKELR
jgi:hypothetical protein